MFAETVIPQAPHINASVSYVGISARYDTERDFLIDVLLDDRIGTQHYQLGLYPLSFGFDCSELLFKSNIADVGSESVEAPAQVCDIAYFSDTSFDGQTKAFSIRY